MSQLSQDIAALELAQAEGRLRGRDLEVITIQVQRAEAKIIKAARGSALLGRVHAALVTAGD